MRAHPRAHLPRAHTCTGMHVHESTRAYPPECMRATPPAACVHTCKTRHTRAWTHMSMHVSTPARLHARTVHAGTQGHKHRRARAYQHTCVHTGTRAHLPNTDTPAHWDRSAAQHPPHGTAMPAGGGTGRVLGVPEGPWGLRSALFLCWVLSSQAPCPKQPRCWHDAPHPRVPRGTVPMPASRPTASNPTGSRALSLGARRGEAVDALPAVPSHRHIGLVPPGASRCLPATSSCPAAAQHGTAPTPAPQHRRIGADTCQSNTADPSAAGTDDGPVG